MIRPAISSDYQDIAKLQIASWRTAYQGLLPDEYLGDQVHQDLMKKWTSFQLGARDVLMVAEADEILQGFAYVMGGDRPYVDNLHVNPDAKRGGFGTALMAGTARALMEQGDAMVWLTVMTQNLPAVNFYEKIGGQRGEVQHNLLYGQDVTAVPMTWTDLPALAGLGD